MTSLGYISIGLVCGIIFWFIYAIRTDERNKLDAAVMATINTSRRYMGSVSAMQIAASLVLVCNYPVNYCDIVDSLARLRSQGKLDAMFDGEEMRYTEVKR